MKEFSIYKTSPEDAEELVKYLNYIGSETDYLSFKENEFAFSTEEEKEIISKSLKSNESLMLVAKNTAGDIIAESTCFSNERRSSHVFTMGLTVKKLYWGQGIGKALVQKIIEECKHIGCQKIMLHVYSNNSRAIEMYKGFGFQQEGILQRDVVIGDQYFDTIIMSKFLNN